MFGLALFVAILGTAMLVGAAVWYLWKTTKESAEPERLGWTLDDWLQNAAPLDRWKICVYSRWRWVLLVTVASYILLIGSR